MTTLRIAALRLATLGFLTFSGAGQVSGQSVFNAAGLGVPSEALDGRARSLGNLGIGLPGPGFIPTDPAAAGRLTLATGVIASQPSWVEYSTSGTESGSFQANRFPLLGVAYPIFQGMASIQIGSFLDQRYTESSVGSVDLSTGTVPTLDEFVQNGSVSNVNLGYSRLFGRDIAAGLGVGRYAGSVVRTLTRTFEDGSTGDVDSYVEEGRWSYTGHHLTAGVSTGLGDNVHVAASVQIPTALDASASDETEGADRTYDLPVQYRFGASATYGTLLFTGSAVLADWSGAQDALTGAVQAGSANGFGVGLEFSRARLWGRDAPLRFGFRRTGLPFSFGSDDVIERIMSGGVGLALNTTNDVVLAAVDLAIERGRRSGMGVVEKFWRATVSFKASGF